MRSLSLLVISLGLVACSEKPSPHTTTAREVERKASEALKATGRFVDDRRKALELRMEEKVQALDTQLVKAREAAAHATGDAKKKADSGIEALERKRDELARKMGELKGAAGNAWEQLGDGVERAADELEKGLKEFRRD